MRRPFMKRLFEKVEATLIAAAFAEESEVETARQIAGGAIQVVRTPRWR
jgi:hypothetical protein